jgi:predicted O-methyltransferase YrrM
VKSVSQHFALWIFGLAAAETQTTGAEREALRRHASGREKLVEVGVWHGVTTCKLRTAMSPSGTLFAVDPYPAGRLGFSMQQVIAHREVSRVSNGRVIWIRKTGAGAVKGFIQANESVDFVFIDGDHSYEGLRGDWEGWSSVVRPGGIVALHDSCSSADRNIEEAGSVRYTREVILVSPRFESIETIDSLTVLRRLI